MTQEEFNQDRSLGFRPGVVVCIINPESKVLLGLKKEHQVWEIPQGGIETQDKTLAHAVKREISEELGKEFAEALFVPEDCLLDEDKIIFPAQGLSGEKLKVGEKEIMMIGKKYYFCATALTKEVLPENLEYSEFKWVSFDEGMEIVEKLEQKGKKRILRKLFNLLKKNGFIK
ncbi:hypothetical protein A2311_00245 [candidate division WOR-1 bacterium RIFOXYB2_FULL_48_7]|uniref:Nudix hydrolase domain-containing protein n=1 Tax=candidate division WOR-1 bacterium RIFOXYB2_FULL_48_7 TaxID=1802583 RepID=A0A1F4TV97_UNCSA|nr:MAG: hypothetical protein A2311_00245 [candidate division WOR-1 bacterium RIFOXYB2_FULL_48_7]